AETSGRPRSLARAWLNRAEVLSGPLNRLAEAADAAEAGVTRLRRLGLDRSYAAALAATLANTLFRPGRWRDADPVIDDALAARPGRRRRRRRPRRAGHGAAANGGPGRPPGGGGLRGALPGRGPASRRGGRAHRGGRGRRCLGGGGGPVGGPRPALPGGLRP